MVGCVPISWGSSPRDYERPGLKIEYLGSQVRVQFGSVTSEGKEPLIKVSDKTPSLEYPFGRGESQDVVSVVRRAFRDMDAPKSDFATQRVVVQITAGPETLKELLCHATPPDPVNTVYHFAVGGVWNNSSGR